MYVNEKIDMLNERVEAMNARNQAFLGEMSSTDFANMMMTDTIRSGHTESVVNDLLANTFANRLLEIHHSRQDSL